MKENMEFVFLALVTFSHPEDWPSYEEVRDTHT